MKQEDTICWKVTKSIEQIDRMIKTGEVDAGFLAKNLHKIRQDAQTMENALKLRKQVMIEAGIEDDYKQKKKIKNTPPGINTIAHQQEYYVEGAQEFDVTVIQVKENKVLYKNRVKAGIICFVENVSDVTTEGAIEGQSQKLIFGHALAIWFAFDQLRQEMEALGVETMQALHEAVKDKKLEDPKLKKKLLDALNQK